MTGRARMVASVIAIAVAGCGGARTEPAARCDESHAAVASAGAEQAEASAPNVRPGACETDWLPAGVVTELPPAQERELVEAVRAWLAGEGAPLVDAQRGVLFAKSEDDQGGEPPFPTSSAAQSTRACGLSALWLRDHLRALFAMAASPDFEGVRCQDDVCCFSGMEYMSDRAIVFRRVTSNERPAWVIESATEVAEAALDQASVSANRAYVAGELTRLANGTCPGEPPGLH